MGEYEPNDSRNVTGTAASNDGRWTNQDGKTPGAAGQPQQAGGQSGQQGGASGADAGGSGGVSFEADPALRQEVQQDGAGGQAGTFTGPSGGQAGNSQAGFGGGQPSGANPEGAGYAESGQQRQFEQSGGQMGGGAGTGSQFAEQIREDMMVHDADGNHIGTVDRVEGERIKLTREGSPDGEHRYIALSQVEGIEGDTVRLSDRGDTQFGMNAE